jgi:hypothetical protein
MNKRIITVGFIILGIAIICKLFFVLSKTIKVDDFHKAAVVFVLDSTVSNQKMLPQEIQYLKSLCAILDPEDAIKIIKVTESSYLIYEGSPGDTKGINGALGAYTKNEEDKGAAYGEGIKKAVDHCLTMKKEGYIPGIVVIGDLSNDGVASKQINWETLPENIRKTKQYIPELAMMFVYAPPEKLDLVKTKLNPVLGEKKLIIANSEAADRVNTRFLKAIGR